MSRFVNSETGVVVVVDDAKDERFASPLWSKATAKAAEKKSTSTSK